MLEEAGGEFIALHVRAAHLFVFFCSILIKHSARPLPRDVAGDGS